jgi:hypothetical protein
VYQTAFSTVRHNALVFDEQCPDGDPLILKSKLGLFERKLHKSNILIHSDFPFCQQFTPSDREVNNKITVLISIDEDNQTNNKVGAFHP